MSAASSAVQVMTRSADAAGRTAWTVRVLPELVMVAVLPATTGATGALSCQIRDTPAPDDFARSNTTKTFGLSHRISRSSFATAALPLYAPVMSDARYDQSGSSCSDSSLPAASPATCPTVEVP